MPHRTTKAIGERGKTNYIIKCPICEKNVNINGYVLRDFEGFPLNKAGQRLDYTFPDKTAKQGPLCNDCNNNHRNKIPLLYDEITGKWKWM